MHYVAIIIFEMIRIQVVDDPECRHKCGNLLGLWHGQKFAMTIIILESFWCLELEKTLSQVTEGWNLRFSWGHLLPLERLVRPSPLRPTPSQPLRLEWIYCRASGWHQHTHTHGATRYFKYLSHLLAYLWQRNSIRIKWQKEYSGLFFFWCNFVTHS